MLNHSKQFGVTLIELVIAIAISTIIVAALLGLFFMSGKHNRSTIEITKLDSELNLVLNSLARDIQRAGYWGSAETSSNNPFMQTGTTDIQITGGNCILMTYDRDSNGALPGVGAGSDDERYGYRLMLGAIQYRQHGAPFDCAAAAANWINLTDTRLVTITAFQLALTTSSVDIDGTGPGTAVMQIRRVTVTITGQLAGDSSVTRTLSRTIKVYNDKYVP